MQPAELLIKRGRGATEPLTPELKQKRYAMAEKTWQRGGYHNRPEWLCQRCNGTNYLTGQRQQNTCRSCGWDQGWMLYNPAAGAAQPPEQFPPAHRGADQVRYLQRMFLEMWTPSDAQPREQDPMQQLEMQQKEQQDQANGEDEEDEDTSGGARPRPVILKAAPPKTDKQSDSNRSGSPAASETTLPPIEGKFSEWLLLLSDHQLEIVLEQFAAAPSYLETAESRVRQAQVLSVRAKRKLKEAEYAEQSAAANLRIAILSQAATTSANSGAAGSQGEVPTGMADAVAGADMGELTAGAVEPQQEDKEATAEGETAAGDVQEPKRPVKKRRMRK